MDKVFDEIYLARQPILNADGVIEAYELLFRNSPNGISGKFDAQQATAQVLSQALGQIGISKAVGSSKAFVNFDRTLLMDKVFEPLDPDIFVIEILENVTVDSDLSSAVQEIADRGFKIALDDFVMTRKNIENIRSLLPVISFIKCDILANSDGQLRDIAHFFRNSGIRMLAEKVETMDQFRACNRLGFSLFQGYFFAKPTVLSQKSIGPSVRAVIQLLQVLKRDPDHIELENAFKAYPAITLGLLKLANSVEQGLRTQIESVGQAVSLIGYSKLEKWLLLLLYASKGMNSQHSPALLQHASQRAKTMQALCESSSALLPLAEKAFLIGLFSLMDTLCGIEIKSLASEFQLEKEITEALTSRRGDLGYLLNIAIEIEAGHFDEAIKMAGSLGIQPQKLFSTSLANWSFDQAMNI